MYRIESKVDTKSPEYKENFEKMDEKDRWEFDQERLWNPYSDSRVLNNPDDRDVKKVLMGINIDGAELLVADRLNEKGEGIGMVIGHFLEEIGHGGKPGLPLGIQVIG